MGTVPLIVFAPQNNSFDKGIHCGKHAARYKTNTVSNSATSRRPNLTIFDPDSPVLPGA